MLTSVDCSYTCVFNKRSAHLIMIGLDHENIIRIQECLGPRGAQLESLGPELHAVYLVQELLDSDLHHLIQSGQLTEAHSQLFLYQVLKKSVLET